MLRGGGVFELEKLFFHLLCAILYIFHTLPQAKYSFHSSIVFLSTNLNSKLGLSVDVWVKETSEVKLNKYKRHLMMPSEAMQTFLSGPLNIYSQHVFQTIIYFIKKSLKILHPPLPWGLIGGTPTGSV